MKRCNIDKLLGYIVKKLYKVGLLVSIFNGISTLVAQSAGDVEYTDCISADR